MSETDYDKFHKMMIDAGWVDTVQTGINGDVFHFGDDTSYYPLSGVIYINNRDSDIGDWKQWVEAGQTPPPF